MPAFSPKVQNATGATFTALLEADAAATAYNLFSPAPGQFQYRVANAGNVIVFLGIGRSIPEAQANATSSLGVNAIPILPGTVEVFSFGVFGAEPIFFAGKTASGVCTLYITSGFGE